MTISFTVPPLDHPVTRTVLFVLQAIQVIAAAGALWNFGKLIFILRQMWLLRRKHDES